MLHIGIYVVYLLDAFTLKDSMVCGNALRATGDDAATMKDVAGRIVDHLFDHLIDSASQKPACALVRLFKTHPLGDLPEHLQRFAQQMLDPEPARSEMRCLTLLGTRGIEAEWSQSLRSRNHQAIPLSSEAFVRRAPMISQLMKQLGLEIGMALNPDHNLLLDVAKTTFNVFYVENALGSPFIPAQDDFVRAHAIQSVIGFGGMLPSGSLFAVILFTKVKIPRSVAELFKPLALEAKLALLNYENRVFKVND